MGAARRRQRREAKQAAKELLKAGIQTQHIGRLAKGEQLKSFMLKVVSAAEKRIDTGEGNISVREGIAAAKAYQDIDRDQRELIDSEPSDAELAAAEAADAAAEAAHEEDVESQNGTGAQSSGQNGRAIGSLEAHNTQPPPLRAAG
ncbi:MAG: hypothetical protein IT462_09805 [Planctomycetes bacterium]|nr:hypothetical protein [Planctomycetota bacterium]